MLEVDVSYLPVLVAAAIGMAVGAFWYSPALFGKAWAKLAGVLPKKKGMAKSYIAGFAGQLVTAFVLAAFIASLGASTAAEGMKVGFWVWLGFLATSMLGMILWENKPPKLYLINSAYSLVQLGVMAAVLAAWS